VRLTPPPVTQVAAGAEQDQPDGALIETAVRPGGRSAVKLTGPLVAA
jgi:hypothetical protein